MRVVRNTGYIRGHRRAGKLVAWAGGLAMLTGMLSPFLYPDLSTLSFFLMIPGFLGFNFGMQQVNRWARPGADEQLDDALRRLNDRYTLIHYPGPTGGHPDHLLIGPNGVLAITTRRVPGVVTVKDNKWSRPGGGLWRIMAMGTPQLGNPTAENERERRALAHALETKGLPGADDLEGIIVFLPPPRQPVRLNVVSSDLTAVTLDKLLGAVRALGTDTPLSKQQREELVAHLSEGDEVEGPISLPMQEKSKSAKNGRRARVA